MHYSESNSLVHITRTAINSSNNENNSSEAPQTAFNANDEASGSEPETRLSTRSSTPAFSEHPSDSEEETEEPDETENDKELSDGREHADQELTDGDNGDDTTVRSPYSSTVPAADRHPILLIHPAATMENAPADVIMDGETSAPNRRPKRVIRPRVRADQATMDDSDCANSDCDDPKRPGKLIKCAGLGCQTKVRTRFVNVLFTFWVLMFCCWSLSFIVHASPLAQKKAIGSVITYVVLIAAFAARGAVFKAISYSMELQLLIPYCTRITLYKGRKSMLCIEFCGRVPLDSGP